MRDWTEAGVRPRLHAALLAELRSAGLLDLDDCAVDGSPVRDLNYALLSCPRPELCTQFMLVRALAPTAEAR
jgi:hypothetical protein